VATVCFSSCDSGGGNCGGWFFHFSNEWIEAPTIKKLNELMAATQGVDPFYPLCASSADHFRIPESERFRSDPV
jgi:hypothetical protein